MSLVRDSAAIAGAIGCCLLLVPGPWASTWRRAIGLALVVAAWIGMVVAVLDEDLGSAVDWASRPRNALALAVGSLVGGALVALLARIVRARPWTWFVMLALALPVRVPLSIGSSDGKLLVPLYLVILIGLVAWVWGRVRGELSAEAERPTILGLPLAAFLAFSLVSILWSPELGTGTAATHEGANKAMFFYLPFPVLFMLVLAWWRERSSLRALAITTAIGGAGIAVLALMQYQGLDLIWNERLQKANDQYSRLVRVNGIFFDPNILGRFLVLGILGAVAWALWSRSRKALPVGGGLAALQMAGLVTTFSRSSALQLLVGLAMLSTRALGGRRVLAVGSVLAVVLGGAAVAASSDVRRALTDREQLERVSEGRFDLVEGGLEIWRDQPVLGTGLGGFEARFRDLVPDQRERRARVFISHNTPVTVLSETGVIGLGLFGILCVWTWALLRRRSRAAADSGWIAWTGLAMLTGIVVHSLLYAGLFEDPYLWVIAAGSVAVLAEAGRRAPDPWELYRARRARRAAASPAL